MRKLTLDLDLLDVQSFDATPEAEAGRGTVRGQGESGEGRCTMMMCPSHYNEATTCMVSDLGSCGVSCGSCGLSCAAGGFSCVTCNVACEEDS